MVSGEAVLRRIVYSLFVFIMLFLPALSSAADPEARIPEINGVVKGSEARVRFVIENAFTPEMIEALKSGIEISFVADVRVEREHRNWFDVTLGKIRVARSLRYDALARVYRLHGNEGDETFPDVPSALSAMTRYDVAVRLDSAAEPGKRYRAFAKAKLDRVGLSEPLRSIFFFSSLWDRETGWGKGNLSSP